MSTSSHYASLHLPRITTVLTPLEQAHVDGASRGIYTTIHRTSINEALHDVRGMRANVVLISAARYDTSSFARLNTLVEQFPCVPRYMLLADHRWSIPHVVRDLCDIGIKEIIDVRKETGWSMLRRSITAVRRYDIQQVVLETLHQDLHGIPDDCWRFFEVILTHRPYLIGMQQVARHLHVLYQTLESRFRRHGLPLPIDYIKGVRHIRAASLFENPGYSVATVAKALDFSSAQAFHRHMRSEFDMTPVDFRMTFTGASMLEHFRDRLIWPYVTLLRDFHPIAPQPGWAATYALPGLRIQTTRSLSPPTVRSIPASSRRFLPQS